MNFNTVHAKISSIRAKFGFTLAEVLITLSIIGIVAVMTIPTLYAKIQHKILVLQFKQAYINANAALKTIQNEEEKEYLCYLVGPGSYKTSECPDFYNKFFTIQKATKSCGYGRKGCGIKYKDKNQVKAESGSISNSGCSFTDLFQRVHILPNGVTYYNSDGGYSNFFGIDINGGAGPNKWGYDVFYVTFIKDTNNEFAPIVMGANTCMLYEKGGYTFTQMVSEIKKQ